MTRATSPAGRYHELVGRFELRPIRDDAGLDLAIAMVDSLIDREQLDSDERDYLEVLSDLVEKYEAVAHPLPDVPEADMLRHLIEALGVTQTQVAVETGIAESTISAILSGKRGIARKHITTLARYFKVSPAVFIVD